MPLHQCPGYSVQADVSITVQDEDVTQMLNNRHEGPASGERPVQADRTHSDAEERSGNNYWRTLKSDFQMQRGESTLKNFLCVLALLHLFVAFCWSDDTKTSVNELCAPRPTSGLLVFCLWSRWEQPHWRSHRTFAHKLPQMMTQRRTLRQRASWKASPSFCMWDALSLVCLFLAVSSLWVCFCLNLITCLLLVCVFLFFCGLSTSHSCPFMSLCCCFFLLLCAHVVLFSFIFVSFGSFWLFVAFVHLEVLFCSLYTVIYLIYKHLLCLISVILSLFGQFLPFWEEFPAGNLKTIGGCV